MRLHKHREDGVVVFSRGEGYDCPPERACWFEVLDDTCLCKIEPAYGLAGLVPCPPDLCERDDHDHDHDQEQDENPRYGPGNPDWERDAGRPE